MLLQHSVQETKSTKPLKMPGLTEESVSSCPRKANSKVPQNVIILDALCLFVSTSSLCFLTAILWPSSSCVAVAYLGRYNNRPSGISFEDADWLHFMTHVHILNQQLANLLQRPASVGRFLHCPSTELQSYSVLGKAYFWVHSIF